MTCHLMSTSIFKYTNDIYVDNHDELCEFPFSWLLINCYLSLFVIIVINGRVHKKDKQTKIFFLVDSINLLIF